MNIINTTYTVAYSKPRETSIRKNFWWKLVNGFSLWTISQIIIDVCQGYEYTTAIVLLENISAS